MTSGVRRTDRRELVLHRNNFHAAKFTGPLLRWGDLGHDAQAFLTQELISSARDSIVPYVETLHYWGVMCPHPTSHRLYEGLWSSESTPPFEQAGWFGCSLCGTRVINRVA